MEYPRLLAIKNIKLSTRTALLFGFGLLLIISLSISLTWFFFLREINALELHATIETNRQAQQTIQIKLNDMASRTGDWAFWDETYQLTTQGDASYRERNLNADSLKINDVDLMVFLSRTGEYVDGAHFSAEQHSTSPVSSVLLKELLSARGIGRQLNVLLHTPNPELKPVSG
jgi:sensor domain CHASE-containing protein